jgi:hypothetical protein
MTAPRRPGIAQFWQEADRTESGQDPLERELQEKVDAVARYRRLISEAEENGRDEAASHLMEQHDREARMVEQLRARLKARSG